MQISSLIINLSIMLSMLSNYAQRVKYILSFKIFPTPDSSPYVADRNDIFRVLAKLEDFFPIDILNYFCYFHIALLWGRFGFDGGSGAGKRVSRFLDPGKISGTNK